MGQRAAAPVHKVAAGANADEVGVVYGGLIEQGALGLRQSPHTNSLSDWMNDPAMTRVLQRFLEVTAETVRRRESDAIIDSSKLSQMRTVHSRSCDCLADERPDAHWMKAHVLMGLETQMALAVIFSESRYHDINYLIPLVEKVRDIFDFRLLSADKAYLSTQVYAYLKQLEIEACIPLRKRWGDDKKSKFYEICEPLITWYHNKRISFDEVYRYRGLIESYFRILKRMADGFC